MLVCRRAQCKPMCYYLTTVLDYIKNNVTKQCDQNQEAAKRIEGLLKDYEAKLKDLEEALDQAKDLVEKANTQNGLNTQAMLDLQVMIAVSLTPISLS